MPQKRAVQPKPSKYQSLLDSILGIYHSMIPPSPIDDPTKKRRAFGITKAQREYSIDKYVDEANRGK